MNRYFAYGSNMNPARMDARECAFLDARPARLPDFQLVFNKRAHNKQGVAYANIAWQPGATVEGVLYTLASVETIGVLDFYEGTPQRYSRDCYWVETDAGRESTWIYVANPAFLAADVLPEGCYLQHLLAGAAFLSADYLQRLKSQPVLPDTDTTVGDACLRFNH